GRVDRRGANRGATQRVRDTVVRRLRSNPRGGERGRGMVTSRTYGDRERGRRSEDATRLARHEVAAGRWSAEQARWYVLAQEVLAADARGAWARAGAPRRRLGER